MKQVGAIIAMGLFLALSAASATTVIPMSVEDLTQASEQVVEATAVAQWSVWNPQHTVILTYTRFQVTNALKGSTAPVIVVKQLGGRHGDQITRVAGVRYFSPNQQTVLFLHPAMAHDGTYVITGVMQGNFWVERESARTTVSNGVTSVRSYEPNTRSLGVYEGSRMSLSELESRVHKAVGR